MALRHTAFCLIAGFSTLTLIVEVSLSYMGYPTSYSNIFMFDETIGYRFSPGKSIFAISEHNYEVRIDADGIFDRYGKEQTEIVLLGDGVITGLEQEPEDRLAYLIGSCTGKTTVNLAVPGYGTVQQLIALDHWIKKNGPPEMVFLVYNSTNDYFDNVQEWEGKRIPGISGTIDEHEYILPTNPSLIGTWLRIVAWNSRLYALYEKNKQDPIEHRPILPKQQKWLFSQRPPSDSEIGDQATHIAATALHKLSSEYEFDIQWIIWRDLPAENLNRVNIDIALDRLSKLLGIPLQKLTIINNHQTAGIEQWDKTWLHPGTRHANNKALRHIAKHAYGKLGKQSCF